MKKFDDMPNKLRKTSTPHDTQQPAMGKARNCHAEGRKHCNSALRWLTMTAATMTASQSTTLSAILRPAMTPRCYGLTVRGQTMLSSLLTARDVSLQSMLAQASGRARTAEVTLEGNQIRQRRAEGSMVAFAGSCHHRLTHKWAARPRLVPPQRVRNIVCAG